MRRSFFILALGVFLCAGASAFAQEKPSKCCAHMCPVANATTKAGFHVVSKAAVYRVKAAELLS